VAKIKLDDLLE
jgi:hypothetical protein